MKESRDVVNYKGGLTQRLKRKVGILGRRLPRSCGELGCPWSGTNARFMESLDTQESLRVPHFS